MHARPKIIGIFYLGFSVPLATELSPFLSCERAEPRSLIMTFLLAGRQPICDRHPHFLPTCTMFHVFCCALFCFFLLKKSWLRTRTSAQGVSYCTAVANLRVIRPNSRCLLGFEHRTLFPNLRIRQSLNLYFSGQRGMWFLCNLRSVGPPDARRSLLPSLILAVCAVSRATIMLRTLATAVAPVRR